MNPTYPWIENKLEEVSGEAFFDRLPHAVLIDAYPRWGVEELACRLTQKIVGMDGDPREIPHPDVLWIRPEDTKLKIERVRDAIDFVHLSSQVAARKVAILESIELASIPASNALLKSLEEPPANVHWILTTTAYALLLPTIRSRCTRLHLHNADRDDTVQWLLENKVPQNELENLMIEFGDAPFAIKEAFELKLQSLRTYLLQGWRDKSVDLSIATLLKEQDFYELLARWLRITARIVNSEKAPEAMRFWDELIATRRAAHEQSNLNRQIQIERLLIQWFRMKQKIRRRKAASKIMQH
ncbi:MAG: hypothetical protein F4X56_07505 [Gammaproteobacteria bacterium]|nr:hypothetical protein [Gammaproteobacteria bacterium]